jgi:peptidoglycan-associated lipoprotein
MPSITITANPATIQAGQSTTLSWTAQNATGVTIEPGLGTVATNGMQQVTPNATVTYTATATGPGGIATADVQITVNVPPPPPPPPPPAPDPTIEELFTQNMRPVYFEFDRSEIRENEVPTLNTAVNFLQQNAGVNFTISGHADERGTQEYNIGLGDRRANSVRQFFLDRGIAAGRMMVVSFGEERPVCTAQNEPCWAQNRRDEFEMR